MKKLFLMFILLASAATAYGERAEIIVSPTYVNQKKENGSKVGKYALGSGSKFRQKQYLRLVMEVIL